MKTIKLSVTVVLSVFLVGCDQWDGTVVDKGGGKTVHYSTVVIDGNPYLVYRINGGNSRMIPKTESMGDAFIKHLLENPSPRIQHNE